MNGAELAVGDQGDDWFLTEALDGSEALYLIVPPKYDAGDFKVYYNELGDAAVTAIKRSGIKKVVFLSSLGAEKPSGTGPVVGLHDVDEKLRKLSDVDIVFLRHGYFMENLLGNMEMISAKAIHGGPIPADIPVPMAATTDIVVKAAELLASRSFKGHTIIEIVGDRISFGAVTAILGNSLGIHDLPYIQFSDSDAEAAFTAMGLSKSVARSYVELMRGIAGGLVNTTVIGHSELSAPTRFQQFADEVFRPAFLALRQHATA